MSLKTVPAWCGSGALKMGHHIHLIYLQHLRTIKVVRNKANKNRHMSVRFRISRAHIRAFSRIYVNVDTLFHLAPLYSDVDAHEWDA